MLTMMISPVSSSRWEPRAKITFGSSWSMSYVSCTGLTRTLQPQLCIHELRYWHKLLPCISPEMQPGSRAEGATHCHPPMGLAKQRGSVSRSRQTHAHCRAESRIHLGESVEDAPSRSGVKEPHGRLCHLAHNMLGSDQHIVWHKIWSLPTAKPSD